MGAAPAALGARPGPGRSGREQGSGDLGERPGGEQFARDADAAVDAVRFGTLAPGQVGGGADGAAGAGFPVEGVQEILAERSPELANNQLIFPDDETLEKAFIFRQLKPDEEREIDEAFQKVIGA